jgi:hypothetical protein
MVRRTADPLGRFFQYKSAEVGRGIADDLGRLRNRLSQSLVQLQRVLKTAGETKARGGFTAGCV